MKCGGLWLAGEEGVAAAAVGVSDATKNGPAVSWCDCARKLDACLCLDL